MYTAKPLEKKITIPYLNKLKQQGEKFACLTAYDYSFARLMDRTGVEVVLVGDSLGMVIQGQREEIGSDESFGGSLPNSLNELNFLHNEGIFLDYLDELSSREGIGLSVIVSPGKNLQIR